MTHSAGCDLCKGEGKLMTVGDYELVDCPHCQHVQAIIEAQRAIKQISNLTNVQQSLW